MAQLLQRKVAAVIMLMESLISRINIALSCCATSCVTSWVKESSWERIKMLITQLLFICISVAPTSHNKLRP